MKKSIHLFTGRVLCLCLWLGALGILQSSARAGLTMTLDIYRNSQGQFFNFYTPLSTNTLSPAAPLGTYIIDSPGWPTNGSQRAFDLTAGGLADHYDLDSEHGYSDFNSMLQQITNGTWTITFTNNTVTNTFAFKVTSPSISSNNLPATVITYPSDNGYVPGGVTTFMWLGPTNWGITGLEEVYNNSFFQVINLPPVQTQWSLAVPLGTNYTFNLNYSTNLATPLFLVSTPLNIKNSQPISGWAFTNLLESGGTISFNVFNPGPPNIGHTNLAFYTFDDNTLFTADVSGNGNGIGSFSYFQNGPFIVTNDTAYGPYAVGFPGGGWLNPPTNLVTTLSGSFSVSLWVKTTNAPGNDLDPGYNGAGLVAANSDETIPMGQTGSKLAFSTGGYSGDTLHSTARINTGNYTHVVVTRDASSGQKDIYVNGVLDASDYDAPGPLTASDAPELFIGETTTFAADFKGEMDQIQFYSGVLSSNDAAFLYHNPGTNVANVSSTDLSIPVLAVYDFEETNNSGADNSGNGNDANCYSGDGSSQYGDIYSTNAASGNFARQFFGHTSICFYPGSTTFANLSNALSQSFSVTAWVKTTNSVNNDDDNAYLGMPILADYSSQDYHLIPLAITGSKAAFAISDPSGFDVQLHSTLSVNDGNYHLLAVTRNATNGVINLYVDGNLNATTNGTTEPIILTSYMFMAGGTEYYYNGLLDDVRFYGGVLTADDISRLYGSPTATLGYAVNTPQLAWSVAGDTAWSVETTNTVDGVSAAQSGSVTNQQSSTITTTVNGPGVLSFYWSCLASGNFDYEFDIDGSYDDDIYGDWAWSQDTAYLSSGPHTLTWTTYAYGDTDPTETGYLDEVSYLPNGPVNIPTPQMVGANFQIQFQSLTGFTYEVQYTTNLVSGNWQTYRSLYGDGTLQSISVPLSTFSPAKTGFVRVATQ